MAKILYKLRYPAAIHAKLDSLIADLPDGGEKDRFAFINKFIQKEFGDMKDSGNDDVNARIKNATQGL